MKYSWILFLLFSISSALAETPKFTLEEATIDSIHQAIKTNQITCTQLITAYLARIKQYNLSTQDKPPINALTEINTSVLTQAQQLDEQYAKTKTLTGPLHCIPVILKDNIDSYDTTTTAGSFALLGSQPQHDAFLVAQLRKAGALILAKGGMDEFGFGMYGISSRNGRVGNAYNTSQNPGGSSSGTAAAISANFAVIGIGTDNTGSVRVPAAFNGLIGLRPSTGMISQHGIFPIGNIDCTAGPITRSVKDLAIVLDVLNHRDTLDPKTKKVPREKIYTEALEKNAFAHKKIGIVRHVANLDIYRDMPVDVQMVVQAAYKKIHDQGAEIKEIDLPEFDSDRRFNQAGEMEEINDYLASFISTRKNFLDICQSDRTRNFGSIETCIRFMGVTPKKSSKEYVEAVKRIEKNRAYIEGIMRAQHLDALLIPVSTEGVATYNAKHINSWQAPVASNAGLPSITFPVGYLQQMPVGIELIGKTYNEAQLIAMAYAFESNTSPRALPILPSPISTLSSLSIPELNDIFTRLGVATYNQVLKNTKPQDNWETILTPIIFQKIALKELEIG